MPEREQTLQANNARERAWPGSKGNERVDCDSKERVDVQVSRVPTIAEDYKQISQLLHSLPLGQYTLHAVQLL